MSCAHPDPNQLTVDEVEPPSMRVALQHGWASIRHDYGSGGELRRRTLAMSIGWRPLDSITLIGDVGAVVGGDIVVQEHDHNGKVEHRYAIEPGMRVGLGVTWRAFDEEEWLPFVLFGAGMTVLSFTTQRLDQHPRMSALDFRSSIVLGKLFESEGWPGKIGPYIVGRMISGALYWKYEGRVRSVQPGDRYQVGWGVSVGGGDIDAYAEVTPFGERAAVFGLGIPL